MYGFACTHHSFPYSIKILWQSEYIVSIKHGRLTCNLPVTFLTINFTRLSPSLVPNPRGHKEKGSDVISHNPWHSSRNWEWPKNHWTVFKAEVRTVTSIISLNVILWIHLSHWPVSNTTLPIASAANDLDFWHQTPFLVWTRWGLDARLALPFRFPFRFDTTVLSYHSLGSFYGVGLLPMHLSR